MCSGTAVNEEVIAINQNHSIFRPRDVALPHDNTGFAYILMSTKDPRFTYIGSTNNIRRRFHEHNSGFSTKQTAPASLRPWALLGYVTGFNGEKRRYRFFETSWINQKNKYCRKMGSQATIEGILNQAENVIQDMSHWEGNTYTYRFVRCGSIDYLREQLTAIM